VELAGRDFKVSGINMFKNLKGEKEDRGMNRWKAYQGRDCEKTTWKL
jgi:hypothetical protein